MMSKIEIHISKPSIIWQEIKDLFCGLKYALKISRWFRIERCEGYVFIHVIFFQIYWWKGW